ncbi:glycosyltransferase [Butyrivibrio fibrisolvens]|uniref:glycosyltransferase n=1 Tax=Butyrivibrio fibrisolvens TaxID=831 RepID=UPI0003FDEAEE|nr:glycosyltransferase [Butyrivibrio fibrisolvens]
MNRYKVGIDSHGFRGWSGGIDLIATIAEAIICKEEIELYLIVEEQSIIEKTWIFLKNFLENFGNINKFKNSLENEFQSNKNLLDVFHVVVPNIKIITYKKTEIAFFNNREKKMQNAISKKNIDIIMPSYDCNSNVFDIPRIEYIFDFQHKYFPELFSESEKKYRESFFEKQIKNSKYILVNAQDVKKDINKFYPDNKCEIFVLPFKPFQKMNNINGNVSKYDLPSKYYVISNQFWQHKSHITAFEALEKIYNSGITDLHIVCTGKMVDYRNPDYINWLVKTIKSLNCVNNIHFVGFVPKDDQIEIMRKAIGLIQPTLFEGGPGGGATYNAICLGKPCLLSDISVNLEASSYIKSYYFEKKNADSLARLMVEHMNEDSLLDARIQEIIKKNKVEYGNYIFECIKKVIDDSK